MGGCLLRARFPFPPPIPHLSPPRPQARALTPRGAVQPAQTSTLNLSHFCDPALRLPTKLPQCGRDSTLPGFPSMTPGVCSCNKGNANGQRMPVPFESHSTIHPCGLQAHWEHLLPPPFFWQLVHHRPICAWVLSSPHSCPGRGTSAPPFFRSGT